MSNVIYRIVSTELGTQEFSTLEELFLKYEPRGNTGDTPRKPCLKHQPYLQGLLGPMYDGKSNGLDVVRYETQRVYDILSK